MARPWNERDGLACLLEALNRVDRSRDRQDDIVGDVLLTYVLHMDDSARLPLQIRAVPAI